jgi:hypothetical protein
MQSFRNAQFTYKAQLHNLFSFYVNNLGYYLIKFFFILIAFPFYFLVLIIIEILALINIAICRLILIGFLYGLLLGFINIILFTIYKIIKIPDNQYRDQDICLFV